MTNLIFRSLRKDDIQNVFDLLLVFPGPYPKEYVYRQERGGISWLLNYILEKSDAKEGQSFILEINQKIIGHIAYIRKEREQDKYEVWAIAVHPQYQNQGYCRKMIEYVEKELIELKRKTKQSRLIMMWQCSEEEIVTYKKLGAELWYICPNWWAHKNMGVDRIVMYNEL